MSSKAPSVPARTPAKTPSSQKKGPTGSASAGKQQSIMSFFGRPSATPSSAASKSKAAAPQSSPVPCLKETTKSNSLPRPRAANITPIPSSDAVDPPSSQENMDSTVTKVRSAAAAAAGLPSPVTPAEALVKQTRTTSRPFMSSSPTRKARKAVNYAESDDEDEDPFQRIQTSRARRKTRALPTVSDDEDDYKEEAGNVADAADEDDIDDFIVSDDSDAQSRPKKRKRAESKPQPRKRASPVSKRVQTDASPDIDLDIDMDDVPSTAATCMKWAFDENAEVQECPVKAPAARAGGGSGKFSAFEKQYWEIKHKLWDTIVFFKKGKFYELYENDATIGHQLFDLKLTDRVNMRMVGVPESSLDMWVNQFVAKGYKVARVDQMESALGKEMRERDGGAKAAKPDKIIRRELACVLTGGTLVDGSMLQDDMATYCAAIKESIIDGKPAFGIAFVDAATGRFAISEFEDDIDMTKFETFVAQTSPRELIIEKSHISTRALRILKNSTSPTTIWNYRKAGTEFWDAYSTRKELDSGEYFSQADGLWPETLQELKDKDLALSALGALIQYLRSLKLEQSLISQGNFEHYNPIQRNGTLILDGQTLINLEIFANNVDGGTEGTLFGLLNRCVTPFGKRLFRQWVCHPLCNIEKINERLDAVDMLNADRSLRDQFTSQMTKMPDLERLISRVHAGSIRADDFVKVLEGFEQIEYTMSLLGAFRGGSGIVDRLIKGMPNLTEPLTYWNSAFKRDLAKSDKMLVPERGIDEDYDASQETITEIKERLSSLLEEKKKELKCRNLKFTDIGKEIYQIEAPKAQKVPSNWRQMSATSSVKRYYFTQLTDLVRELQEAEETHSQIIKETASRFFVRFDEDYNTWLLAVRIMAQLDCLVGLARASSFIGQPSCRPEFIESERSVVDFSELRHPCMQTTVTDFIPNDVKLGGDTANISLLTGANAAGKSTVLRMSCVAVIMAQVGCYVPAVSARLTPVDRIMSRLGANDNIFAAQSTFFVELSETKKILSEATPRSLVILDELGRGTSSYDGVAVAQAIRPRRMQIHVDDEERRVTFLYRLEDGVAEGSFGMHCASMCGIPARVVESAEVAAKEWEHTSRLKESLDKAKQGCYVPLGVLSDVASVLRADGDVGKLGLQVLLKAIEGL
ncbi:unnamed protein product [Parascedosporium putredinis]|uniref:DNA mismatch repair protein n=1 Tax=Parascedosporium putredinis TaxID=1442378 RepID=A0A9P1HAX3_9PEZI|nr:unnamed protein product [Parascedosporium putredinis]CAI8003322.1 unnamed protein product [Parascedosporium putredinis]